ncbi:MAG: proline racemase family protein, partial [Candidatus Bathyarchaeia archaeon]
MLKIFIFNIPLTVISVRGICMKVGKVITVVETHSSGETTKVVVSGFPRIPGKTMWEKTQYCKEHLDNWRKALMMQPRGFSGILGAIITEPANPKADYGVIFTYTGGYFNSCGDSTFSVTKVLIEQGMVEVKEPITEITLDTAAGLVKVEAKVENDEVQEISFEGISSFYEGAKKVKVPDIGEINVDVAFGGLYYVFVDPDDVGVQVKPENARELIQVGMKILNAANKQIKVEHPENPELNKIELVTFSAKPIKPEHNARHANVYADTICVSPAGTSVSAKLATLWAKGKFKMGERLIVESLVHPDLTMIGEICRETKVGKYKAVVPKLSARAYIIGLQ